MNLLLRFLIMYFTARFAKKVNFFDFSYITLTVLPTDIDFYWHMNNGRYLSMMDLGRMNFTMRNQILFTLKNKKVFFFLVAGTPPDQKQKLDGYVKAGVPNEIPMHSDIFFLP